MLVAEEKKTCCKNPTNVLQVVRVLHYYRCWHHIQSVWCVRFQSSHYLACYKDSNGSSLQHRSEGCIAAGDTTGHKCLLLVPDVDAG